MPYLTSKMAKDALIKSYFVNTSSVSVPILRIGTDTSVSAPD